MDFLTKSGVFKTALKQDGKFVIVGENGNECRRRLRGQLTLRELKKYIRGCLKPGKAEGPERYANEVLRAMTEDELEVIRVWVNSILTDEETAAERMTEDVMNGTIRLLHKGGDTADTVSDWRPVVLLNCCNQLVMHVINSRLRAIVEKGGILTPGQGGGRQGRSVSINMSKMERVTTEAQRLMKRVYRVDVDFKNAFNAMNQAALWKIMESYNIPDVDLLKALYEHSTVRVAPNDRTCATIRFDTGVAQGSALSPLLFLLFMNALMCLLTEKGKIWKISHGIEGLDQFNNIGFVDDCSLFAQTTGGMQVLMNTVQEFEEWSGLKVNLKKTCMLIIDGCKKRRKILGRVTFRGEPIKTLKETESCRYLGFWGTANGDMTVTKEKVKEKARNARDMLKHHPLTPELALELFMSIGVGVFRFSAALVQWTWRELMELQTIWVQAYKYAWRLPLSTASDVFIFPVSQGGLGYPVPVTILTQELGAYLTRCQAHEDVTRQFTKQELEEAKELCQCSSFRELQTEVELWEWDKLVANKWTRWAKCLSMTGLTVHLTAEEEAYTKQETSWAGATRDLRKLRRRVEAVGGRQEDCGAKEWELGDEQWPLLWEGEEVFWSSVKKMRAAGYTTIQHLPQESKREGNTGKQMWKAPRLARGEGSDGLRLFRVLIPQGIVSERERGVLQRWFDMIDWHGRGVSKNGKAQMSIQQYLSSQTRVLQWVEDQERIHETMDGEDVLLSVEEYCSKLTLLKQVMAQAGEKKKVLDGMNPGVHSGMVAAAMGRWIDRAPNRTNETDQVIHEVMSRMPPLWQACWQRIGATASTDGIRVGREKLDRLGSLMTKRCGKCQTYNMRQCSQCKAKSCVTCGREHRKCVMCDKDFPESSSTGKRQPRDGEHGKDRFRKKGINMHKLGEAFVGEVLQVRKGTNKEDSLGKGLQFLARVRGWDVESGANRRNKLLMHSTGKELCRELVHTNDIVRIPRSFYPDDRVLAKDDGTPEGGWWYRPTEVVDCKKCIECDNVKAKDEFEFEQWQDKRGSCCKKCKSEEGVKRRKTTREPSRRSSRNEGKNKDYTEPGNEVSLGEDAGNVTEIWTGVRCEMADPRYIGVGEEANWGDVILTEGVARKVIQLETQLPQEEAEVWMTTSQMGHSLEREETELVDEKDDLEGKETARFLAPEISKFIRRQVRTSLKGGGNGMDKDEIFEAAWLMDQVWGVWEDDTQDEGRGTGVQQECNDPSDIRYHGKSTAWHKTQQWEAPSTPMAAFDPEPIPDYGQRVEIGRDLLLDDLPAREEGKGYVSVAESSFVWKEGEGLGVKTFEGLTTCFEAGRSWTIMSGIWNHLKNRWTGSREELTKWIWEEKEHQGRLEDRGYRSPTWKMLEALKTINGATRLYGESAVTAAPMFEHAGRDGKVYWGDTEAKGPMVVLWDSLTDEGKKECLEELKTTNDWVIWRKDSRKEDEDLMSYLMKMGREEFRGRAVRGQEEQKGVPGEEMPLQGRAQKGRGWWRRGDAGAYLNGNGMKCWVHKDMHELRDEVLQKVQDAWDDVTEKDTCTIDLTGPEKDFWMGSEAGMLGCYWFRGVVFAGDGSDHRGRMGAGAFCLGDPEMKQCVGVGREEEGTSSNRPELAALVLALRATKTTDDMLYLCDNQALLKAVQKWTGDGPKQTMVNAPDADILREIIELLKARVATGAATFLVKVKAHRGEPLNELADTLAEEAREAAKEHREWSARTDRMVYQWEEEKGTRRSVWTAGVRKAVRKGAGQFVVKSTREKATKRWRELHFERGCQARLGGRVNPQAWMQSTEEGLTGLRCGIRSGDVMDIESWSERCDEALKRGDDGMPSTTTWAAGFLLRKGQSREALGKWLTNRAVPWKRRRRTLQVITGTFPCGKWLHKIKKRPTSECERCKKAWMVAGKTGVVPDETVGHIQSVQCVSQEEVVTAAHNRCWREIMGGITKHGSAKRSIEILERDKEQTLKTLWREEKLDEFFPRQELVEEMHKLHEEHREAKRKVREDSDMGDAGETAEEEKEFSEEEAIWARKLDGAAIDKEKKILYVLEFKRTTDQREEYEEGARVRAEKQYEDLVQGLLRVGRKQNQGWTAKQITFVGGTCGSVNVTSFEENLKELQVLESKWGKMRADLARKLLEEQDTVFRRYYETKWGNGDGGAGRASAGGREHVGRDVYIVIGRE